MLIAGVDEAGRGPLAGPVAVAAVILGGTRGWRAVNDSKQLSASRRAALAEEIKQRALAYAVVLVHRDTIDRLNIYQATMRGMQEVVAALMPAPQRVLVDGNRAPKLPCDCMPLVGGDGRRKCIAAASILAKVARDDYMARLDARYPGYGFAQHKGYPTSEHLQALQRLGPTPEHRRSFAPVHQSLQQELFA